MRTSSALAGGPDLGTAPPEGDPGRDGRLGLTFQTQVKTAWDSE
ncbi:MAG: hypothetical protein WKF78_13415 [Candidatus Limnocylindrales bacterium]